MLAGVGIGGAGATVGLTATLVAMPSPQDQLNLVEELDRAYGPLVIYAWLRAERFDFQKVRDMIELSRLPFDELLQATSPIDLTSPIVD